MIRVVWAVLCRSSSIDKDTNSLSLFDIFEELALLEPITEKGHAPLQLQLVSLWGRSKSGEPAKATARASLSFPSGSLAGKPVEFQIDLTTFKRLRHRLTFTTFPIAEEGVHEFLLEVRASDGSWVEANRIFFELQVRPSVETEKK